MLSILIKDKDMKDKDKEYAQKSSLKLPSPSLALEMRDASSISPLLNTPTLPFAESRRMEEDMPRAFSPFSDRPHRKGDHAQAVEAWKRYRNVDRLLELIYDFYRGGGRLPIMLELYSSLAMVLFVVNFGIFLVWGVNWGFLGRPATALEHPRLWEVAHFPRMPLLVLLSWIGFMVGWGVWLVRTWRTGEELRDIELIYEGLLGFDANTMRNVDFDAVIAALNEAQKDYPLGTGNLDAYTVCNRLMRRDNYLIALFNKNILDLQLPILKYSFLTRHLEWNLNMTLLGFVFDERFNVKKRFTRATEKKALAAELTQRFRFMAAVNLALAPVIFLYLVFYFFLRYAEEIYRNPGSIGLRSYSRVARWRFREFNELPHYFEDRLEQSHRKALKFLDQFHNRRMVTLARLVGFIAGSFIAILLVISFANEDLLMHFELTRGKSPIWYLPIFGLVLAVCRAVLPNSYKRHDAKKLITQLTEYTHYNPPHWQSMRPGQIATEFRQLFRYRIVGISEDFLGILAVPWLLWFRLPEQSEAIVDFFREFTVHVDGLGYVCSFALFDFANQKQAQAPLIPAGEVESGMGTVLQPGKMQRSYLVFRGHHPQTAPIDEAGEELLSQLNAFTQQSRGNLSTESLMQKSSVVLDKMARQEHIHNALEEGEEEKPAAGLINLFDRFYYSSMSK